MNIDLCSPNCVTTSIQPEQHSEGISVYSPSKVLASITSAKRRAVGKCRIPVRKQLNAKGFVKRPRNGFFTFLADFTTAYRYSFPKRPVLVKVAADCWRAMGEHERKDFLDRSAAECHMYHEMKEIMNPRKLDLGAETDSVSSGRHSLEVPKTGNSSINVIELPAHTGSTRSLAQAADDLTIAERSEDIMKLLTLV